MSAPNKILPIVIPFVFNFSSNFSYSCLFLLFRLPSLNHFLPSASRAASPGLRLLTSLAVASLLSLCPLPASPALYPRIPLGLTLRAFFSLSFFTPFVDKHILMAQSYILILGFYFELQILKFNFLLSIPIWVYSRYLKMNMPKTELMIFL